MTNPTERLSSALAGRYRIERELGAGGMATVYLAEDLKHNRKVAIKVLRPELAALLGAERFVAEIKTTAQLQHPHILPLFDSGSVTDGPSDATKILYYVMPYVEGETLREKLAREKQLGIEDALQIAQEVAAALDYAHRQGLIHRDIKPENVLLKDGHALVADFGIALAVSAAGASRLTETGISLGTPHYMSPEQATGDRDLTPRSDVYSLAAMLYEMLVGDPPFQGSTAQAILARVMTEEPRSVSRQRHTVSSHVDAVIAKALEKLPADRFATASDFAHALRDPSAAPLLSGARAATALAPRRLAAKALPWAIVAVVTVAAAWNMLQPRPSEPVIRYALALPPSQMPDAERPVVPSPDGSALLFVGPIADPGGTATSEQLEGVTQLWIKRRDDYLATPLPGTAGAWMATFSPDGRWIAFEQGGKIAKLPVTGGAPVVLGDSAEVSRPGIAWLDDGTIVYMGAGGETLRRVRDVGGDVTVAFRSDSGGVGDPHPLPKARGVLFSRCRGRCDIWALDLNSGDAHQVIEGTQSAQYLPEGHLLFLRGETAFLTEFDLGSLTVSGQPVKVLDSVATAKYAPNVTNEYPLLAISRSGTMVMRHGTSAQATQKYDLVWVDRAGNTSPIDMGRPLDIDPWAGNPGWSLADDGRHLAIGLGPQPGHIWVKELPSGPLSRVTFDSGAEFRPRWMPGGRWISFISERAQVYELHRVRADGTGGESTLARDPANLFEGSTTPDGKWIVTRTGGGLGKAGRKIIAFHEGDSIPVTLVSVPGYDASAVELSPDGHWIAYESDETGRREVYVRPFPDTHAGRSQISTDGGYAPLWARSGRELFFVDVQRRMTVVRFTPGPSPDIGERHVLFRLSDDLYLDENDYYTPFDISLDGRRFVMARRVSDSSRATSPIIVTENWFTELETALQGH